MYRKILIVISIILLALPDVFSQQKVEVSGRVIDAETKLPVEGVNVLIKGRQIGTVTGPKGYFYLKANMELPFTIKITMIGYQSEELTITKKLTSGIRVKFKSTSYIGEEIVFSAPVVEVEEKNLREAVSVEMLDALGVKETPSPSFYNALSNLKGVDVVNQSMQFMTVNARGFNSTVNTRFVQIVDGMDNQAPGMNFAIGNIAGLNELDVESIEFLPGPSSARHGGNVLNGLLIMNSKDPFKFQGLSLYIKPGVSDVKAGSDHPFQFLGKGLVDMGFRFAKSFGDRFALKITSSYMKGEDWFADDTTNIRPGNIHYEYDPGHDALNKYGDEITKEMPLGDKGENIIVARTGYRDKYLVDDKVFSFKFGGAAHYRLTDRTTAILEGNYGNATTVYTEDNRTSLSNFKIFQGKLELTSDRFMLRAFGTKQITGKTYDSRFLAIHLNNSWKSNEDWFRDYKNAYSGRYAFAGIHPGDHKDARKFADSGRLMPGTEDFEREKQKIINNPDFSEGAQLINNSALYNIEGRYSFLDQIQFMDIEVGGNYRYYDLESQGTFFPDTSGNDISYFEYGAYLQLKKSFFDEDLSLTASLRYDKSGFFKGNVTPRISALYVLNSTHFFRASILTGYRTPSAKEQFVKKNLGPAWIIGGLQKNIEEYHVQGNGFYRQGVLDFNEAVYNDVNREVNPLSPAQATMNNLDILNENIVKQDELRDFKTEQIFSYELGYKTKFLDKLFVDAVFYNSFYRNFIGLVEIVKPRTSPQIDMFTAANQANSSSQSDVLYIYTNSKQAVTIHGLSTGLKYLAPIGAIISGNFTWSHLASSENDPIIPGFNTPEYKFNISIANRRLDRLENNPGFKNLGFNVVWRWQSRTLWQSPFGNGWIEPVSTWDVQASYRFHKPESIIKLGVSNFFNVSYTTSFGSAQIGSFYYISYTVENLFNSNKNKR